MLLAKPGEASGRETGNLGVLSFGSSIKAGNARHRCAVGMDIVVAFTGEQMEEQAGCGSAHPDGALALPGPRAPRAPLEGSQDGDCRVWKKTN